MALNCARETFTFGGAGYVDQLTRLKQGHGHDITRLQLCGFFFGNNKFMQATTSFYTSFRKMTGLSFIYMVCFLFAKSDLDGCVAVGLFGFDLGNAVCGDFQHGYGD